MTRALEIQRIPASADVDTILKAFKEDGCVIITGVLSPSEVNQFNSEIQPAMDKTPANNLIKRFSSPVTESSIFRHQILDTDLLYQLSDRIFGRAEGVGYWFNATQVIDLEPGAPDQRLHRDQELFTFWNSMGPSAPEPLINFFCPLTRFTKANGATCVVPKSHLWPEFTYVNGQDFEAMPHVESLPAEMDAGDCLLLSSKVVHKGGHNSTTDETRRALAFSIIRHDLRPIQAHPFLIPLEVARTLSPRVQGMYGFRSSSTFCDTDVAVFWSDDAKDIGLRLGLSTAEKMAA